jgi:hypothetical protein
MCCNPAKGRVQFEDIWLIKSSFITNHRTKACQIIRPKSNNKKNISYFLFSAEIETPEEREERRRRFIKFLHTPFSIPHQS